MFEYDAECVLDFWNFDGDTDMLWCASLIRSLYLCDCWLFV